MAFKDEEAFGQIFAQLTGLSAKDNPWVNSLYGVAKKYIDTGFVAAGDSTVFDLVLTDNNSPELQGYRDRFSAYLTSRNDAIANGTAPEFASVKDYIETERAYIKTLNAVPGFNDLATIDNIKKFVTGRVSVDEVAARVDNAFYAVQTADQALKDQLKTDFPSISDADLAKALVTGDVNSVTQKVKFGAAGIKAEAKAAGLQTSLSQAQLEEAYTVRGIDRTKASEAFQSIKEQQGGLQQSAQMFGQDAQGIQTELEKEQLLGVQSKKKKALASQARAQFGGVSGIQTGSLSRSKSGQV